MLPAIAFVMEKTCTQCSASFEVTDNDAEFYNQISVPVPTLCPDCRMQRRQAWCNERFLYHNTCAKTGKPVISELHPSNPIKVWNFRDWWSDAFHPLEYGRDIDWGRPILEQLHELRLSVPHPCVLTDLDNENSDFTHHAGHEKNCYLMFHASFCEDCYYGYGVKKSTSCIDCYYCHESELCYECVDVKKSYTLHWCQDCLNCSNCQFIRDCIGCKHCFLCTGLRNREYCILNEQLTKQEYKKRMAEINFGSHNIVSQLKQKFAELQLKHTWKHLKNEQIENSTGNYLYNAKDCDTCFDCSDIEGCKHCAQLQLGAKFCYDVYQFGINVELCYECAMVGYNIYQCAFCYDLLQNCNALYYCISCSGAKNSFACFGLRQNSYCILNKQYSEQEYHDLFPKIVEKMKTDGEWGEFFPISMSQAAYNESTADLWFPLSKAEIQKLGYRFQEQDESDNYKGPRIEIPDDIRSVADNITEKILLCETSGKPYKIIPQELKFYKEQGLPIPRQSFQERHKSRFAKRDPRRFWRRSCSKCNKEIQSTYAPDRPEIVYCESCYLSEVY